MKPTKVVGVSSFIEQGRNTFLATRFCAQLGAHGLQAFGIRMERPDAGLLYDYLQLKACRKVTSTRGPKGKHTFQGCSFSKHVNSFTAMLRHLHVVVETQDFSRGSFGC